MRTPQQIVNLRKVISMQYGPFANMFLSDLDVDGYADRIQAQINNLQETWTIRSKVKGETEFTKEPRTISCSFEEIKIRCGRLLSRYEKLEAIEVSSDESGSYTIERENERIE